MRRALSSDALVILSDGPTGNLDADTAREITVVLKESAHECGKCVVVVTHSAEVAKQADVVLEQTWIFAREGNEENDDYIGLNAGLSGKIKSRRQPTAVSYFLSSFLLKNSTKANKIEMTLRTETTSSAILLA